MISIILVYIYIYRERERERESESERVSEDMDEPAAMLFELESYYTDQQDAR